MKARREASQEDNSKIRGLSFKLLSNSCYGSLLLQKCKHRNVKFVQGLREAKLKVNNRRFSSMCTLSETDQIYEFTLYKQKVLLNVPIVLGFFVLQYAKLMLLQMYYDFFIKFCKNKSFELVHCDTDSIYICHCGDRLVDIIKPEMLAEFNKVVYDSCNDDIDINPGQNNYFLTRDCCQKHRSYDQYESGMWKQEYFGGQEAIGLSSKSYILISGKKYEPSETSISQLHKQRLINKSLKLKTRGVMKRLLINKTKPHRRSLKWIYKLVSKGVSKKFVKNPVYIYRHVIRTQERKSGCIKGIRLWDNSLYSYMQNKSCFSYFYIKREVMKDGSSTRPLQLLLKPVHRPLGNLSEKHYDNVLIDDD